MGEGVTDRKLAEEFIGKTVVVVRTQAPPIRGELIEPGSDGIIIQAEFQDDGLHDGRPKGKRIFVPWSAVQALS